MNPIPARSLEAWLTHLETAHSAGLIDMGLARVAAVRDKMNLRIKCPVVTVAGTNGKGSVCAFLSQIFTEAGYRVGTLTSPHLVRFNERTALNTEPVSDAMIVEAFERIEAARGDVSLTYFEFNTLAAVDIFCRAQTDVMVLEVGLGGRLDAVNIFDADVAVVTSVDLDHEAYLGDTIEKVAFEKAGIFRANRPVVCGQYPLPESLAAHALSLHAPVAALNRDFFAQTDSFAQGQERQWRFVFAPQSVVDASVRKRHALPLPALQGKFQLNNAACALAVLECLPQLPVDLGAIKRGLVRARNPGRLQIVPGQPMVVLDVAHNPHAARALAASLERLPFAKRRIAVFAALADKDLAGIAGVLNEAFDAWYVAGLNVPRGQSGDATAQRLKEIGVQEVTVFESVEKALQAALSCSAQDDRITVFGSFHTVAEAMTLLNPPSHRTLS